MFFRIKIVWIGIKILAPKKKMIIIRILMYTKYFNVSRERDFISLKLSPYFVIVCIYVSHVKLKLIINMFNLTFCFNYSVRSEWIPCYYMSLRMKKINNGFPTTACTVTEATYRLEILDLSRRGIVLSE